MTAVGTRPARYCTTASLMPRARSTMTPSTHSVTEATKPGLARVTRMPWRLAASTSMLRMSTAQRHSAITEDGRRASSSAPASVRRSLTTMSQPCAAATRRSIVQSASSGLSRTVASAPSAASARSP